MRNKAIFSLAFVATMAMGACAGGQSHVMTPEDALEAASSAAKLHVQNNNWADVDVYMVRNGMKVQLGMVTSMQDGVFTIPESLLVGSPNVQIMLDPVGSRIPYYTQPILVNPGQLVDLRVENNLSLTSYSVFR